MHGISRAGTETRSCVVFSIFNAANATYAVAPKHMGDLKLLPPKLALERINTPPSNQHVA